MGRRKKEKRNAKKTAVRRYGGGNPLYPEQQEGNARGVLTALASVAGAVAVLALIVMNFSYYVHPERLEGQTQGAARTAVEAGEPEITQTMVENAPETQEYPEEQQAGTPAPVQETEAPAEASAEPAAEQAVQTPPESMAVSQEALPAQIPAGTPGTEASAMPQDIESLEGTGVAAQTQGGAEGAEAGQVPAGQSAPAGQPPAGQSAQPAAAAVPGDTQIFADSSRRYLTDGEVSQLSQADIQTAINEVFARHGYIFETQEIFEHFRQYEWYNPTVPKDSFDTSVFNDYETRNVELLSRYRQ